ncbi:beta-N-acetylhexosaminidase [Chromatium weissei]|nr:beta-N-acetylhexosaminidase [Chromatium weissei]
MLFGSIMLDVAGTELTAEDRELLRHPAVGGVILFARNYVDPAQLAALTAEIAALRDSPLLIAVDQEGGRVQRFRDGFTRLPAAEQFGAMYARDAMAACRCCEAAGWLMATELRALGVNFSFAPVLDLQRGISQVIGDRGFSAHPATVTALALAWQRGVQRAGMIAVGKHFPGHGGVAADSHIELPTDARSLAAIEQDDLVPFRELIANGLAAVMPAHVIYAQIDAQPAGFSTFWLQRMLRERLNFQGVIFSDDLNMAAAAAGGDHVERAQAALQAGCDLLLICNNRAAALRMVDAAAAMFTPLAQHRLLALRGAPTAMNWAELHEHADWLRARQWLAQLDSTHLETFE